MRRFYMRRPYMAASAIITVAGLTAAGVAGAGAASAAPCSGHSCAGLDPATTGCNQYPVAKGPAVVSDGLVTLKVWSSAGCNSKWAQAYLSPSAVTAGYSLSVNISTLDSAGTSEFMCYPSLSSNTGMTSEDCNDGFYHGSAPAYTDMVDGTNTADAEVQVFDGQTHVVTDTLLASL